MTDMLRWIASSCIHPESRSEFLEETYATFWCHMEHRSLCLNLLACGFVTQSRLLNGDGMEDLATKRSFQNHYTRAPATVCSCLRCSLACGYSFCMYGQATQMLCEMLVACRVATLYVM